jgi:2,4-dienoyl-CoA reductase-like NADH-dependent reductase (Old Yellow Enzyme family)/thioredoxin reductase
LNFREGPYMNKYPNLFTPIKLGELVLRNRILQAPMGPNNLTPEGYLTPETIAFYEARAAGGAAVVTIGESIVHSRTGAGHKTSMDLLSLDNPAVYPSLRRAARAIKHHGAIPSIELQHAGKYGGFGKNESDPRVRYGPSHEVTPDGQEILEMPEEMILEIVEAYGKAAFRLKEVGFEMLLIHAGHGWLLHQFISPVDNKRKDKYGGSLENRARFALMVVDSVRKAVGPRFPIEFRMSGDEFREGGYHLEDGIKLAKMVDGKVDLIHVSAACHGLPPTELFVRTHPIYFWEHGCNVYLAAAIKREVKTPVACVGALNEAEQMEKIIASGQADVVAVARALLADPNFPKKAAAGKILEITPCIRCLYCITHWFGGEMTCTVNPKAGREFENKFMAHPPVKHKRVLIAGGGPAGLQAAITASERGHQVILCEKSPSLGGVLKSLEGIPFKEDVIRFKKYLEHMVNASGTVVILNQEVTPEFAASQHPDVLIAAVGAEPVVPAMQGIRNENVVMANDIRRPGIKIGKTVVILGGGLVGCEEAIYLAMQGKEVTVVEMLEKHARDANGVIKLALGVEFRKYSIRILTGTRGKSIEKEGLLCIDPQGKEVLYKADTIICALGQKSLTYTVDQLRGTAPEFYFIGDCVKPQKIVEAITAGYDTAMDL